MKDNKKYQDLFNALLIKYGIEPDEEWTNNIVWKSLIDSKLDTKQRNQFYNEFSKLELKYKDMTYNSAKVSTQEEIKEDKTKWEDEPLTKLYKDKELMAFKHHDFWMPMDTLREKFILNKLWDSDKASWKTWG